MANYEFWYADNLGNRLAYIDDVIAFDYASVLGSVGAFNLIIPSRGQIYDTDIRDRRIAVYRQPLGGTLALDYLAILRDTKRITSIQGQNQRTLIGFDLNELLLRRIAAFYANESETNKTDLSDDMMKEIVTENFVNNADYSGTPDPTRSLSNINFSVQANLGQGLMLTKGFSWRNILATLQDIQADSKEQGTETFFGVVPLTETSMQFQTWTTKADRTTNTGVNPLVFSLEWGNLFNPKLSKSTSEEINYAYGAGEGKESSRIIQTAENLDGINASLLNRREGLAYSSGKTEAAVLTDARNTIERNRPKENFTGSIIDTPLTPYGSANGWNLGDKVTVNYANRQFDVIIRAVRVQVQANGDETISARVEI